MRLLALLGVLRPDDKPELPHDPTDTTLPTKSREWPKLPKLRRPKPKIQIPPPIR